MRIFVVICLGLALDSVFGEPRFLWHFIPHPVVIFGKCISAAETRLNKAGFSARRRRVYGFGALALLLLAVFAFGAVLQRFAALLGAWCFLAQAVFLAVFLAQKSLADHVRAVYRALKEAKSAAGDLSAARRAVGLIVGRDPQQLDESGICRAAIESLAENSSDGVVAPLFWFAVLGLPGLCGYKMLNTADSMIGHENRRYRQFGYASAKADDAANFIPARLTGLLAVAAAFFLYGRRVAQRAFRVMRRDAKLHRSPNAGCPESAFAGALNICLGGPRRYGRRLREEKFQNAEGKAADLPAIAEALRLFWLMMALLLLFSAAAAGLGLLL